MLFRSQYGMSEKFGLIGLESIESRYLDGRPVLNCADDTSAEIDKEVMRLLKQSYDKAVAIMKENRDALDKLAEYLFEKETITGKEFIEIFREVKGISEDAKENQEDSPLVQPERTEGTVAE